MKTYFIEPGDWEAATGESLPNDAHGIAVVNLSDFERLQNALKEIIRHQDVIGGPLSRMSAVRLIAQRALEQEEACEDSK